LKPKGFFFLVGGTKPAPLPQDFRGKLKV